MNGVSQTMFKPAQGWRKRKIIMNKSDGGKGSSPRPFSVSQEEYAKRWDAIFQRDLDDEEKQEAQEALEEEAELYDSEDYTCPQCSGSGEGMWDGASCTLCGGTGGYPKSYYGDEEP